MRGNTLKPRLAREPCSHPYYCHFHDAGTIRHNPSYVTPTIEAPYTMRPKKKLDKHLFSRTSVAVNVDLVRRPALVHLPQSD